MKANIPELMKHAWTRSESSQAAAEALARIENETVETIVMMHHIDERVAKRLLRLLPDFHTMLGSGLAEGEEVNIREQSGLKDDKITSICQMASVVLTQKARMALQDLGILPRG